MPDYGFASEPSRPPPVRRMAGYCLIGQSFVPSGSQITKTFLIFRMGFKENEITFVTGVTSTLNLQRLWVNQSGAEANAEFADRKR